MTDYLFPPPEPLSLPIQGQRERFPVRRLFFIGRNYLAHAAEMGFTVDKAVDPAFYFIKSPHALVESGAELPYPAQTHNYHHEVELVVALGRGGFEVTLEQAPALVYGYACGLDMTRRDVQAGLRERGRPWDLAKDVEQSAVCSAVVPMPGVLLPPAEIGLEVNGQRRQQAQTDQLVWSIPEIIADLSRYYHLQAGDLIYTGTPEGVGPVQAGDRVRGWVAGVAEVHAHFIPAAVAP